MSQCKTAGNKFSQFIVKIILFEHCLFSMFRKMHAFMEGYRALKVIEQFQTDLPTYMPKRLVQVYLLL